MQMLIYLSGALLQAVWKLYPTAFVPATVVRVSRQLFFYSYPHAVALH